MAELREILAELLQISDDEDLNFRKEIFSDLFEDNRVSEKLRVLVCGDVNNAFYTKTLDKIFTFHESQAAPFDIQQDYAEFHVMPSSTDEAFPMQILNQYDRMIFISRAPQALGKSAITFLAECGVLRPVVMLFDTDKLEHNEIEDYKSFALTLIRSAGFEHSQIVFPAESDIKTTWDSVIQSIISEDKAISLEEHRETALAVLQQEILTALRKKQDKAEKLEAEHKKESEFSSDMAKMETERILLQIEDDKLKNTKELTSFIKNLIAEKRLKDLPLLYQAFNDKNSSFKKINTKGLDEMLQQQMTQLQADLISKLNNTLEVRIAEWNNLCGQVVCQLNNSPEICEGINPNPINWTPVTLIPPTALSSLLTFALDTVEALKKDPQKTIAAALGTAVSVVALRPVTLPIIALFDVLFVAYQKHELSKEQMCARIAEIWDDCAQKIKVKVLDIMKNEYQSIEQYYKNFCQSRLEKADAIQAKNETLEKTAQAIARCEAIVI